MLYSFSAPSPQVYTSAYHEYLQKMKIDSCDTALLRSIYLLINELLY